MRFKPVEAPPTNLNKDHNFNQSVAAISRLTSAKVYRRGNMSVERCHTDLIVWRHNDGYLERVAVMHHTAHERAARLLE